jgi:hypothetical protein
MRFRRCSWPRMMAHGTLAARRSPGARGMSRLGPAQVSLFSSVIPATAPPSLPAHTFRRAVPSADSSGLTLVDNTQPFNGSVFIPTAHPRLRRYCSLARR